MKAQAPAVPTASLVEVVAHLFSNRLLILWRSRRRLPLGKCTLFYCVAAITANDVFAYGLMCHGYLVMSKIDGVELK